jgi:hypothetical protein
MTVSPWAAIEPARSGRLGEAEARDAGGDHVEVHGERADDLHSRAVSRYIINCEITKSLDEGGAVLSFPTAIDCSTIYRYSNNSLYHIAQWQHGPRLRLIAVEPFAHDHVHFLSDPP